MKASKNYSAPYVWYCLSPSLKPFFKGFIYLDTQTGGGGEGTQAGGVGVGGAGSPLSRSPGAGLDPRTQGS